MLKIADYGAVTDPRNRRGVVNMCAARAARDKPPAPLVAARALTPLYQSPWTTKPLCSVTIVALAIHATATGNSGQLLVCCQ